MGVRGPVKDSENGVGLMGKGMEDRGEESRFGSRERVMVALLSRMFAFELKEGEWGARCSWGLVGVL